jgi:hypothetical protein
MKERVLIALFVSLCLGGCLKILGDYDLNGTDPPASTTTSTAPIPCWFRSSDGFCACQPKPPTAEYDASTACQPDYPVGGLCCSYGGWPQTGTCLCAPIRCLTPKQNGPSCSCGYFYPPYTDFDEVSSCSDPQPCCAKPGGCRCDGADCDPDAGEMMVDSCTVDDVVKSIACEDGGVSVYSCR